MDNQHKKIKGYRDLSQVEIDLMNEIKAKAEETKDLINSLEGYRQSQLDSITRYELTHEQVFESQRCMDIARKELQTGYMWLVRAVALPDSF